MPVYSESGNKTLLLHWCARHLVAVGKGLEESDQGIFFLVTQFKIAELPFIHVG